MPLFGLFLSATLWRNWPTSSVQLTSNTVVSPQATCGTQSDEFIGSKAETSMNTILVCVAPQSIRLAVLGS